MPPCGRRPAGRRARPDLARPRPGRPPPGRRCWRCWPARSPRSWSWTAPPASASCSPALAIGADVAADAAAPAGRARAGLRRRSACCCWPPSRCATHPGSSRCACSAPPASRPTRWRRPAAWSAACSAVSRCRWPALRCLPVAPARPAAGTAPARPQLAGHRPRRGGLTGVLLLVFGSLFASADAAFAAAGPEHRPRAAAGATRHPGVVAGVALSAAFLGDAPPRWDVARAAARPVRCAWPSGWCRSPCWTPCSPASSTVQLTVLFGGHRHVLETAGLTYAEYARGGFGQLVVVTLLTLSVVAATVRWAPRRDPRRNGLRCAPCSACCACWRW